MRALLPMIDDRYWRVYMRMCDLNMKSNGLSITES